MAEIIAAAMERHFVITEQPFGRQLAPAPTGPSAMPPGAETKGDGFEGPPWFAAM
ncbi:hypothetical protein [Aurantimonas endophytica]|uniref:Uncharacterized protein n=1 Tax=Aurantimonas endophytica TaxID=1522175 RepID=A0A7W6H9W2_9HYPH|nr:hypothetical protein [Aurantimonas endophytica]MBB4001227.1 hypothetical protein [Aurantimonas endophytica]MCO6403124.1 hypothetical protein [Aurantimonas endophytica]